MGRLLAGMALLAAAACGSTVPGATTGALNAAPGTSLTTTGTAPNGSLPAAVGVAGGPATTTTTGQIAGSSVTGSGAATSSASGPAAAGPGASSTAAGGVHTPIQLGFIVTNVSNAGSFGVNAGQTYTDQQLFDALVASMNKAGGVAGRQIQPVCGVTDTASANWNTDFQAACAKFTQDHHVAAVLGYIFVFLDSFEGCLAHADVPHLYGGYQPGDRVAQQQYPLLFATTNPTNDVHYLTVLGGAISSGLLTPAKRLGIFADSCGHDDRAFASAAVPFLQAHHIRYEVDQVGCSSGASDNGAAVSAIQNAELKFQADGDDTVFVEGVPALLFAEDAESQHWNPDYLLGDAGAAYEGNVPADQLAHFHGFGWMPEVDVDPQHQPGPFNATQRRCLDMLHSQGLTPSGYSDFLEAFTSCDALFLYADALQVTGGNASPAAVLPALRQVAPGFESSSTYGGRSAVSSQYRGGPGVWRQWGWQTGCGCFGYFGPTHPMVTG